MHALQVSYFQDSSGRSPEQLLDEWQTLTGITAAVAKKGVKVTVLQASSTDGALERDGVSYRFVGMPHGLLRWRATRDRLAACARAIGPDVVHVHGLRYPMGIRSLRAHLPETPILIQDHGNTVPSMWRRPFMCRGLAGIDGVLFTARRQADPFRRARVLGTDIPVFEVLESSTDFVPGDRAAAIDATGLSGDPCLLWIGRLMADKDPLTVLDAVEHAIADLPELRLWCFYTSAPLLRRFRERIHNSPRLKGRVTLNSCVPHESVELLCRAADFFVSASRREAMGFSVIEAMAAGATPILTAIPSFEILTGGGRVGSLSPVGDAELMAQAIVNLSRLDRAELRRATRAHFEQHLTFDVIGARLRDVYKSVISA